MVGAGGLCRFSGKGGGGGLKVDVLFPMLLVAEDRLEDRAAEGTLD